MLVELTYACKMGCSHCMSDCSPDGENMSLVTLRDALDFMIKNNIPTWTFSGGEMFEHPDILKVLDLIEEAWIRMCKLNRFKYPLTFITNGRELVRNKNIYNAVSNLQKKHGKRAVMIQITDDPRFYPDPLSNKEKYWLSKLDAIIEPVPSSPYDEDCCLYPQGRALVNYPASKWNTVGPKCSNCILIAKQKPNATFSELVYILLGNKKVCTPVIAPDGGIKVGESALCPSVASIYDTAPVIMEKIRSCKCHACSIAWERLRESNPLANAMLER